MKTRILLLSLMALAPMALTSARADETITVSATNADISENLDLRAVATLFGEVDNLEQFEQELNSENRHLNNLDLNGDGMVDYLRVVEIGEGDNRLIVIQAVLAKDIYQDVASIYVERQADQTVSVQVVGDTYLYGESYVVEPVYLYRPVIYDWFWGPTWVAWHSPYYWGYYSPYYVPYNPWAWDRYYAHIHHFHHEHPRCSYHYAHAPRPGMISLRGGHHGERIIRNDWAQAHPERSFTARAATRGSKATNARQMHNETRATMAVNTGSGPAARRNASANASAPANRSDGARPSATTRTAAEARQSAAQRTFGSSNTRQARPVASASTRTSRSDATGRASASTTRSSATSTSNTGTYRAPANTNNSGLSTTSRSSNSGSRSVSSSSSVRPASNSSSSSRSVGSSSTSRSVGSSSAARPASSGSSRSSGSSGNGGGSRSSRR